MPTAVPLAAFSATELAAPLASLTAPTANSEVSSLRLTVKPWELVEPSVEVAWTVTEWLAVVS